MIVLVVWSGAVVAVGLILGIVGYGLTGQIARLQRARNAVRGDLEPRITFVAAQLSRHTSAGRHSAERKANSSG
ncbi:MAG: hypothetical protein H0V67_03860 [Geodermatophilaceae bacterium]|nr:hypothetical protein [Geodermatophilaceae bacterium]